jgi:hypothetical protein
MEKIPQQLFLLFAFQQTFIVSSEADYNNPHAVSTMNAGIY